MTQFLLLVGKNCSKLANLWIQKNHNNAVAGLVVKDDTTQREISSNSTFYRNREEIPGTLLPANTTVIIIDEMIAKMEFAKGGFRLQDTCWYDEIFWWSSNGVNALKLFTGSFEIDIPIAQHFHYFDDSNKNKTAYIFGNGPSLKQTPVEILKDKTTFGSNQCYLGFERWGFHFTYWACMDRLQLEENGHEFIGHLPNEVVKFIPYDYSLYLTGENCVYFNQSYASPDVPLFSSDERVFHLGYSVTYTLLQMAVSMGFQRIVLLGLDHNYEVTKYSSNRERAFTIKKKLRGTFIGQVGAAVLNIYNTRYGKQNHQSAETSRETWKGRDAKESTHFDDRYTKGKRFVAPRLGKIESALGVAKRYCDDHGIEVVNATPGTKLDIFPKVDLENYL